MPLTADEIKAKAQAQGRRFWADLKELMSAAPDPDRPILLWLAFLGLFFAFLPLAALIGFRYAYTRLDLARKEQPPTLSGQPAAVYAAMWAAPFALVALLLFLGFFFGLLGEAFMRRGGSQILITWAAANLVISLLVLWAFKAWQARIWNYFTEMNRYGSARFAFDNELDPYRPTKGFYIGAGFYYDKPGHLLTVGSTRSGKGVSLIVPNLTRMGAFSGSWVVVDPKGENAAVTARVQREMGRKVVILNPWNLHDLGTSAFNPLDLVQDGPNLPDDVGMIAEALVPKKANGQDDHWNSRARALITGLLTHLVSAPHLAERRHLGTLWAWLRTEQKEWDSLLQDMVKNEHEVAGAIVRASAWEALRLMTNAEKEFASILSTAQDCTDFLKSPNMRRDLATSSDFKPQDLTEGNVTVYVIIPADRLKTHDKWLRLVVGSLLRAVVRKPGKDVCFLLDEFYNLGYLSEIEVALGLYAGYGVHLWMITQNLIQLRDMYGHNWEAFMSSCSVRQFLTVNDTFTADYVSNMFGTKSVPTMGANGPTGATPRALVLPDELRRSSGDTMHALLDQLPPARFKKLAYFDVLKEGKDYDPNPYEIRKS